MGRQKTAVITGGAGGLGMALAKELVSKNWHVCLLDLPGPALDAAGTHFEAGAVTVHACNVICEREVKTVCSRISKAHGSVDLVIYNAGVSQIGGLKTHPLSAHRKVFDINYFGALHVLRHMLEPVRNVKGTHLAISSVAGFSPLYHRTAYSASKHALEGLFKSLRAEEQAHGVKVAIAAPSFVATNIGNKGTKPGGLVRPGSAKDGVDYMSPADAAREIIAGLKGKKTYIPVGRVARLAWRINRFAPEMYFRLMMRGISKGP